MERDTGAWLRLDPEAAVVVESDGQEFHVPIRGNSRFRLWRFDGAALLAAVASRAAKIPLRYVSGSLVTSYGGGEMNDDAKPDIEPIEKVVERLGADAVFGEPISQGEVTVIPVAEIRFGFGSGRGHSGAEKDGASTEEGSSGGSGAGGWASPKGYIRISPEGVRFEPVGDVTRIVLAGIGFAGWSVFWIGRALRGVDHTR